MLKLKVGDRVVVWGELVLLKFEGDSGLSKSGKECALSLHMKVKMVEGNKVMLVMDDGLRRILPDDVFFSVFEHDEEDNLWHKLDEYNVPSNVGQLIEVKRVM